MPSDESARLLAAREAVIERLHKSAELPGLADAELVAVGVGVLTRGIVPTLAANEVSRASARTS